MSPKRSFGCILYRTLIIFIFIFFIFSNRLLADGSNNSVKKEFNNFDWFWLLYEYNQTKTESSFTIRPFYLINVKGNNKFQASLMPLVFWKYTDQERESWKSFFGIIGSLDYTHKNGVKDYDFGIFPFFLYGNSVDKNDKYMHIWPLGGTIRGKLGQDYIRTYAFPGVALFLFFPPTYPVTVTTAIVILASLMPLYAEFGSKDYNAKSILWPLIQWGKSKERDDIRIIPFYTHSSKQNSYDKYSFLMIFNYQKVFLKNDVENTLFIFPLYGRRWNLAGGREAGTLFWPFFSWGHDEKRGDFEINFPWPIVQIRNCENPYVRKRIFFPLYGDYVYGDSRTSFVTPLYFRLTRNTDNYISDYYINFLIIWYFKMDFIKNADPVYGRSWRYFKIWPFFQYEYDDKKNVSVNILSLFPFRDTEGYEKLYQPFWTLFEYKRFESGEKRFGLLLRLYYQQWGDGLLRVKIPFVLSYGNSRVSTNRFTFTDYCSLVCYNNDKNGQYFGLLFSMFAFSNGDKNYVRIFWIPVSTGLSAEETNAENDMVEDNENSFTNAGDYRFFFNDFYPDFNKRLVLFSKQI